MEEFKANIDSICQLGNDLAKYDKVIEDFLNGLEQQSLISECIVDKTRRPSKKKRNILSSIPDNHNENDNESSEKIIEDKLLLPKKASNTNKTKSGTSIGPHIRRSTRTDRSCKDKVMVKSMDQVSSLEIVPTAEKMPQPAQPAEQLSNTFTIDKIILSCKIKQEKLEPCTSRQLNSGSARQKSTTAIRKIKQNVIDGNCNTSMKNIKIKKFATANAIHECVYEDAISDTVIKLESMNPNERPAKHSEVAVVLQPVDPGETIKTEKIHNSSILKETKVNIKVLQSPVPIRITRMNSRAQGKKENQCANPPFAQIPIPVSNRKPLGHVVAPKQSSCSQTMPLVNVHLKKKYDTKPSKLFGECNADDIKRIAAENRKRIHEEKLKHAQEIREAKERERRAVAERTAREKQGKSKKIVHEREEKGRQECDEKKTLRELKLKKDLQRNLEEIQKNLEISKCMKVKCDEEMRQMKLANMRERDLLEATKPAEKQKQYTFELLLTDDSSEEDDKLTTKKPPPPIWSLATVRQSVVQQQNYVEWKIIDKLFSIQPMTIDLRNIFPNIDSRCLARNSSGIWPTPPRYSVLP